MFAPGSIRKITIKDFVTYSYVELYPGPKLNMILGANGTGKSTIVGAIILGLGGNPKTVGRGKHATDYIKHGCDAATITIHLQGEHDNDYEKISRIITKSDQGAWTLNGQRVSQAEILACIKRHNIQVDNLCQFLPQDRVQDFAKLNKQELLRETQLALCRQDLVDKQDLLIACRQQQKAMSHAIANNSIRLDEAQVAKARLEGKVENFNVKQKFMEQIVHIDRKLAWVQYDHLYAKFDEAKEDFAKATEVYNSHKAKFAPFEARIARSKAVARELTVELSQISKIIRDSENSIRFNLEKADDLRRNINNVSNEMNLKLTQIEENQSEIERNTKRIKDLKISQRKLQEKCESDENTQEKVTALSNDIHKFRQQMSKLESKKNEIIDKRRDQTAQLRAYDNELTNLQKIGSKRLNNLRQYDQHTYEATLWLRDNKNLFRGEVFEPIMLEINVLEADNSKYAENVIAKRDKIAFVCTEREDVKVMIQHLREQRKLSVNVICLPDSGRSFRPRVPIEQLRRYGFFAYLNSLFTAPEPIMRYLCQNYRIHEIPIGNQDTNINDIPKEISLFFIKNTRSHISISKYSGNKIVNSSQIFSDGSLSIFIDVVRVDNLKGKIEQMRNTIGESDNGLKNLDNMASTIRTKIAELTSKLKELSDLVKDVQAIDNSIAQIENMIKRMKETMQTPETIKLNATKKNAKFVKEMPTIIAKLHAAYKNLALQIPRKRLTNIKMRAQRESTTLLENQAEETKTLMREAETTLNQVKEALSDLRSQSKAALKKAKSMSNNCTPDDAGFDVFRAVFAELPEELPRLQLEKDKLASKIDCLKTANDGEIAEYQRTVAEIGALEEQAGKGRGTLAQIDARLAQLRDDWLQPLGALLADINANFGAAFERMGCAGEVGLFTGDDADEFSHYGVSIKVAYRSGEPMQELNRTVQSGGERAVATAAFMLAMQEFTPVPFRCVDEINQGMDAENERRIFEQIIEKMDEEMGTSQYFLITPKLIPNLRLSKSLMIHIVHNGPFIEPDRKWSTSKLCNSLGYRFH